MRNLFSERLNRRTLLKVAGGLLLASVVDLRQTPGGRAEMTRMRWVERDVFPESGVYQSSVFHAEQTFNSVEVGWNASVPPGSGLGLEVRTSMDGETWGEWQHLHIDPHAQQSNSGRTWAAPYLTSPSNFAQYRVRLIPSDGGAYPVIEEVELGCVDTSTPAQFMNVGGNTIDGWIISRAGWGANEDLRFSNGSEKWKPAYEETERVIVHHTATGDGGGDPAAVIRAIYYYHAVTLGWGDIGYNYLVDNNGNVYEGRHGGPGVTGAHTFGYNSGTIGVAVVGNFEHTRSGDPVINAVANVINELAPHLDPVAWGPFRDQENLPNVCSHRDLFNTECPGDGLYTRVWQIRERAATNYTPGTPPPEYITPDLPPTSGEITGVTITPKEFYAGSTMRVDISIRNTSDSTMQTQGPDPRHVYKEHEDFLSADVNRIEGRYRVGIDFEGNADIPNPWRWGIGGPLGPGESTTVTGFIRLDTPREWELSASLVQELVRYEQQKAFPERIVTLPPPTRPTGPDSDPSMHYFEVTSHNVPDIFYRYWEANGGLRRFGYPLTEAIMELSETDGETYLTQYFERARFEHHPEHAGTQYEVLLGLLGRETTKHRATEPEFQPVEAPPDTDDVDYFVETGHTLRGGFRTYWWNNGGLPVFGFPISERITEVSKTDGKEYLVQYFERNRMEWHPEFEGTEYEILLGHLAREILIDRGWLEPDP